MKQEQRTSSRKDQNQEKTKEEKRAALKQFVYRIFDALKQFLYHCIYDDESWIRYQLEQLNENPKLSYPEDALLRWRFALPRSQDSLRRSGTSLLTILTFIGGTLYATKIKGFPATLIVIALSLLIFLELTFVFQDFLWRRKQAVADIIAYRHFQKEPF
ncbi:hypothetical protein [Arcanobacterium haemolyticum]